MARFGRYELLRELGVGGMARVYLARVQGEGGFERLVAIKVLHEHLCQEREFVSMFLDEARLAAQIRHPNVVSTIDVQSEGGKRYLAMDYVEGESLSALLAGRPAGDGSRLPVGVSVRIILDVLAGLHAAHDARSADGKPMGLVHRDVSPHNVLVGKDGLSRITDFGVARAETRLSSTRSGEIKGKLPYMAPEQIASLPVDRRADVYSAGLVFWEMLVGRRHFVADNQGALLRVILEAPLERPSEHNAAVPGEIDAVTIRAITRETKARFDSAAEFADALEDAAHRAGVRVATARQVAALVEESIARKPTGAAKPVVLPSGSLMRVGTHGTSQDDVATIAGPDTPQASPPNTTAGTVSIVPVRDARRRSSAALWAGAAIVLVAGAGALVLATRKAEPRASAASATASAAPAAATASQVATSSIAVPTPSNVASEAASVDTAPSQSATASQSAAPRSMPPAKRGTAAPKSGADFLPGDL